MMSEISRRALRCSKRYPQPPIQKFIQKWSFSHDSGLQIKQNPTKLNRVNSKLFDMNASSTRLHDYLVKYVCIWKLAAAFTWIVAAAAVYV